MRDDRYLTIFRIHWGQVFLRFAFSNPSIITCTKQSNATQRKLSQKVGLELFDKFHLANLTPIVVVARATFKGGGGGGEIACPVRQVCSNLTNV